MLPLCHTIGYQEADVLPEFTVAFVAVVAVVAVAALTDILIPQVPLAPVPVFVTV